MAIWLPPTVPLPRPTLRDSSFLNRLPSTWPTLTERSVSELGASTNPWFSAVDRGTMMLMSPWGLRIKFAHIGWLFLCCATPLASAQTSTSPSPLVVGDVYRPGGDVTAPRVVHQITPHYTSDAMSHYVRGDVVVECIVTAGGVTTNCTVLASLGYGLDESALAAARLSQFAPGTMKGRPVNVRITITNTFTIAGPPPQTPRASGAPIDATALCGDGTYSWAPTESTACADHAGVKAWWGPPATAAVGNGARGPYCTSRVVPTLGARLRPIFVCR